jgi:N-acetylmuramoyl-L-alanine amidase
LAAGVALLLIVLAGCRRAPAPARPPAPAAPLLAGVTVVLDPGHGGPDPGASWVEESIFDGQPRRFYEAAYTYRLAAELAQRLRADGARVVLTVRSRMMDPAGWITAGEGTDEPLPLPRDAVFADSGESVSGARTERGVGQRARVARRVWNEEVKRLGNAGEAGRRVLFLSLHIDARAPGASGAHVIVDRRRPAPRLARLVGEQLRMAALDLWQTESGPVR